MKKTNALLALILCCFTLSLSAAAGAQTPTQTQPQADSDTQPQTQQKLYQVELIAFARSGAEDEENWNRHYDLRYPARIVSLQPDDGSGAPYELLPASAMHLNRAATLITHRSNLRVLLHAAWQQPVDPPAQATAVIISGGRQFGSHHELEGTFKLSLVGHFLRADVDLWLSSFSTDPTAADGQTLPAPPTAAATASTAAPAAAATTAPADAGSTPSYVVTRTVVMQQRRRMRSGELHYFDHPLMGLLVQVTPVTTDKSTAKPH